MESPRGTIKSGRISIDASEGLSPNYGRSPKKNAMKSSRDESLTADEGPDGAKEQKNSWLKALHRERFRKHRQKVLCGDLAQTNTSAKSKNNMTDRGDSGSTVINAETPVHSGCVLLPDRSSEQQDEFGKDDVQRGSNSHRTKNLSEGTSGSSSSLTVHTGASRGSSEFIDVEKLTSISSAIHKPPSTRASRGAASLPVFSAHVSGSEFSSTHSLHNESSGRRKARPRMSAKELIRLELLDEKLAPVDLPPVSKQARNPSEEIRN